MKISIESNIGGGKSSLINKINKKTRLPVFLEPVDSWYEYLDEFYKDPKKWALAFNLNVICSFFQWINNKFPAVYERSPYACRDVFTQLQLEEGEMHSLEVKVFDKIFNEMSWKPDVVIYLKTSPSICMQRIQKRARGCEKEISLDYLVKIDEKYEQMIRNIKRTTTVYEIDGNASEEQIFKDVLHVLGLVLGPNYCG